MASAFFLSTQGILPIFDARQDTDSNDWSIVNDGVMGGLSQSNVSFHPTDGYALFRGEVSTAKLAGADILTVY